MRIGANRNTTSTITAGATNSQPARRSWRRCPEARRRRTGRRRAAGVSRGTVAVMSLLGEEGFAVGLQRLQRLLRGDGAGGHALELGVEVGQDGLEAGHRHLAARVL